MANLLAIAIGAGLAVYLIFPIKSREETRIEEQKKHVERVISRSQFCEKHCLPKKAISFELNGQCICSIEDIEKTTE